MVEINLRRQSRYSQRATQGAPQTFQSFDGPTNGNPDCHSDASKALMVAAFSRAAAAA